jgi:hypothetical protein
MKDWILKNWWIAAILLMFAIKISMVERKIDYTARLYEQILIAVEEQNGQIRETRDAAVKLLDSVQYLETTK